MRMTQGLDFGQTSSGCTLLLEPVPARVSGAFIVRHGITPASHINHLSVLVAFSASAST